jgi:5-bromo-4-chloroindolyl phosphate hydrolysis protein
MPLGGYCEVCSRWVWVNGRGECQFGHPAGAVRDVQSLQPRSSKDRAPAGEGRVGAAEPKGTPEGSAAGSAALVLVTPGALIDTTGVGAPAARMSADGAPFSGAPVAAPRSYIGPFPPARKRSDGRWWWRHSLWIVWTFSLGLFNWLAFLYIGIRARRSLWLLASLVYLLPIALTIAAIGSGHLGLAIGFQLFMSGASVLHAFVARPRYRAIMFGDPPSGTAPAPPPVLVRSDRPALPRGLDNDIATVIRSAQTQVDDIAAAADSIEKPDIRRKVGRLCRTAEDILVELRNEPGQVPLARPFLSYYLEAANRIVSGYVELSRRGFDSPETHTTLARAEASLDSIQRAFDGQLAGLLQHQVLDLDSEIALLEQTVQMDNLTNATTPRPDPATKTGGAR